MPPKRLRAISYCGLDAAQIVLARVLNVDAGELGGFKASEIAFTDADPETRRSWKEFQVVSTLPKKDQRSRHLAG